jgi:hypothetical protein
VPSPPEKPREWTIRQIGGFGWQPSDVPQFIVDGPACDWTWTQPHDDVPSIRVVPASELDQARADLNEAQRKRVEMAGELGRAHGRLEASEWPGVIEGWKRRAEEAESELARAEEERDREKAISNQVWKLRAEAKAAADIDLAALEQVRGERDAARADVAHHESNLSEWNAAATAADTALAALRGLVEAGGHVLDRANRIPRSLLFAVPEVKLDALTDALSAARTALSELSEGSTPPHTHDGSNTERASANPPGTAPLAESDDPWRDDAEAEALIKAIEDVPAEPDWRCECGDLNRAHEAFCYRCGAGPPEQEDDPLADQAGEGEA